MAKNTPRTRKQAALPEVADNTILINCMTPCSPCDVLAHKCITPTFRSWAEGAGYAVVYSKDAAKVAGYWQRYGKPHKVLQATPQVYVVGENQACKGVCVRAGAKVGGYEIPAYDKWNAEMLKEICKRLGVK